MNKLEVMNKENKGRSVMNKLESIKNKVLKVGAEGRNIKAGMELTVYYRESGSEEKVRGFKGVCIRRTRRNGGSSITLRRMLFGVGVEYRFMLYSGQIEKIEEEENESKFRKARGYYLRKG